MSTRTAIAQTNAYHMSQTSPLTTTKLLFAAFFALVPLLASAQNVAMPHFLSTNSPGATTLIGIHGYLGQPILGRTFATESNSAVVTGYLRTITQARALPSFGGEAPTPVIFNFALGQNYPNPFNPSTLIPFTLDRSAPAKLEIFNLLGQAVRSFDLSTLSAGQYEIAWDGRSDFGQLVPSGEYFVRLEHAARMQVRKLTLIK